MKARFLLLAVALCYAPLFTSAAATLYVDVNSAGPVSPYSGWATAATNIQDAVNAANTGDVVLVTNGVYAVGGSRNLSFELTNRVSIYKAVTVQSANGPGVTSIIGNSATGGDPVRCVALTSGATLAGFTLASGGTYTNGNDDSGGGVWAGSTGAFVSNCIIISNQASSGGGAYGCTLRNCQIVSNYASGGFASSGGGGAYNSSLYNCTLSGNSATKGGGSVNSTLYNCILGANSLTNLTSSSVGAGAFEGYLYGCLIVSNVVIGAGASAGNAPAAANATLYNCTAYGNVVYVYGGGLPFGAAITSCTLYNSIIYSNELINFTSDSISLPAEADVTSGTASYCCIGTAYPGIHNITSPPLFVDAYHLAAASPCRGAGSATYSFGTDIDGQPWLNPPSIGCAEYYAGGPLTVAIDPAYTNVAAGFPLALGSQIVGSRSAIQWNFGDGLLASNLTSVTHAWPAPGSYTVTLTAWNPGHPAGVSASATIQVVAQPVLYVSQSNSAPVAPYGSWVTAATNIQDAVNAAATVGSLVLVNDGIYAYGGEVVPPYGLTNRVAATIPLMIQSVNGPGATVIEGGVPVGSNAVRCAYLADGAWLVGFTLTNGATLSQGDFQNEQSGGGVFAGADTTVISNCVAIGNSAAQFGGGIYQGCVQNCIVSSNSAGNSGGGIANGSILSLFAPPVVAGSSQILYNSSVTYAGGVLGGQVGNCVLAGNSVGGVGGGAWGGALNNCLLSVNSAYSGGGSAYATLVNCLVVSNRATDGGGAIQGAIVNCTVVSNFGVGIANDPAYTGSAPPMLIENSIVCSNTGADVYLRSGAINYCCVPVLWGNSGIGNIANSPQFVDFANGNFRSQSNSPCINAGNNAYVTTATDLDGNPRISGGTVDIGAYEFQNPASIISYAWLEQYGLATDGSADYADTDGNGMNNWQKWIAGLNPTNPASILQMMPPATSGSNIVVTWQSVTNISYFLERSLGINPPSFQTIATNIPGQTGTTSYTDTNAPAPGPWFYQVGVP